MIGRTLGHYEILDLLGTGGMGEVYRARDTRLGRDVALKVIPEAIAGSPEIRARFQREAETISSLNHPHICVLHDIGQDGDVRFLVMELVEGITLAQRLRKGPVPLEEALRYGAQIADALERAHRAGVIHRDLKPGNVMLTRSGAKLMDFGLARVNPQTQDGIDVTVAESPASPTKAHPLTAEGAIVGTFQYMAPEQLEGQDVDQRSDLWALGCVLYEMVTGRRAFEGRTQASLIGAIMHHQPDPVSQVAELSPAELDRLVQACLAKDPDERIQNAHDIRLQLEWLAAGDARTGAGAPSSGGARRGRPPGVVLGGVAVAAALVGALAGGWLTRGSDGTPAAGSPELYELGRWSLVPRSAPVFAADGRSILFAVREGTESRIYRRNLDELTAFPIQGTDDGRAPFPSPDGRWLGFVTPSAVMKVPIEGGVPQAILRQTAISSGFWAGDGTVYLGTLGGGEEGTSVVLAVPSAGGPARTVVARDSVARDGDCWAPSVLPDGESILASVYSGVASQWQILVFRGDGSRSVAVNGGFLAQYSRTGHLLYQDAESQATFAAPFDPDAGHVTGAALALTEVINGNYCFGLSRDGRMAYVPSESGGNASRIAWVDPDGTEHPVTDMTAAWTQPRISPDGRRAVVRKVGSTCELWLLDLERGKISRFIQDGDAHDPLWSPDGTEIVYRKGNSGEILATGISGARRTRTLRTGAGSATPVSIGGRGLLACVENGRGTVEDVWILPLDGSSPPKPLAATAASESAPAMSPDGGWVAYVSDQTGTAEVLLRRWPGDDAVWQVSLGGGRNPLWSRDGRRLYYTVGSDVVVVTVDTEPEVRIGDPRTVLEGFADPDDRLDYDVDGDGRILAIFEPEAEVRERVRVLMDWPAKLRALGGEAR